MKATVGRWSTGSAAKKIKSEDDSNKIIKKSKKTEKIMTEKAVE